MNEQSLIHALYHLAAEPVNITPAEGGALSRSTAMWKYAQDFFWWRTNVGTEVLIRSLSSFPEPQDLAFFPDGKFIPKETFVFAAAYYIILQQDSHSFSGSRIGPHNKVSTLRTPVFNGVSGTLNLSADNISEAVPQSLWNAPIGLLNGTLIRHWMSFRSTSGRRNLHQSI